jgi:small conductance mechanosensitive channel
MQADHKINPSTRCATHRRRRSFMFLLLAWILAGLVLPAGAQDTDKAGQARSYEQNLDDIAYQKQHIEDLEKRITGSTSIVKAAIDSRLVRARINLLQLNMEFLDRVAADKRAGTATTQQQQKAIEVLASQLQALDTTRRMLLKRIELPEEKIPAAEAAAIYSHIFQQIDLLNKVYQIDIDSLELARQFGQDVAQQTSQLKQNLLDRAENTSALLEMAMNEVTALRATIAAVPDDAESKAMLNVMTLNITNLSNNFDKILEMMKVLEMDTREFYNQLLTATGQITSDILEVDVFTDLFVGWGKTLWNQLIENGPGLLFKLIVLVVVIYIFYKLASLAQKLTERTLDASHFELSLLLRRMIISILRNTVLLVGVLIALAQIGISLGPVLAGMGVIGFIIGFALQDTLSNFAAGMMILIYRPFDVDDVIEAGGVTGKVSAMNLVNTSFLTFDNQTIIVPNGKIWGDVIKNVTAQTIRRIDLVFGIAYSDDIEKAEKIMADVVAAHPAVLDEPETMIRLHELGDSSVNFIVRPWVNKDDYWETYWALTRAMKLRFDAEGISIPFPQRDVHLFQKATD